MVEHVYDVFGRWIGRQVDEDGDGTVDLTDRFVYDGNQIVLRFTGEGAAADEAEDLSHRYLWGPAVDQLMADEQFLDGLIEESRLLWALGDNLNSVRDLAEFDPIEEETAVIEHLTYAAYGERTSATGAVDTFFGWTGRPFEIYTGIHNNLHRWYDPLTATWTSADPIEDDLANTYRYAGNDPINNVDPDGLQESTSGAKRMSLAEWIEQKNMEANRLYEAERDRRIRRDNYEFFKERADRINAENEARRRGIEEERALAAEREAKEREEMQAKYDRARTVAMISEHSRLETAVRDHMKDGSLTISAGESNTIRAYTSNGFFDVRVTVDAMRYAKAPFSTADRGKEYKAAYDVDVRFYPAAGIDGIIKIAVVGQENPERWRGTDRYQDIKATTTDAGWRLMNGNLGRPGWSIFNANTGDIKATQMKFAWHSNETDAAGVDFSRTIVTREDWWGTLGNNIFRSDERDRLLTRTFIIGAYSDKERRWLGYTTIRIKEDFDENRNARVILEMVKQEPARHRRGLMAQDDNIQFREAVNLYKSYGG